MGGSSVHLDYRKQNWKYIFWRGFSQLTFCNFSVSTHCICSACTVTQSFHFGVFGWVGGWS